MTTQVASLSDDFHFSAQLIPVMRMESESGAWARAECEAFGWRRLGPNIHQVLHRGSISILEAKLVLLPNGSDRKIVG